MAERTNTSRFLTDYERDMLLLRIADALCDLAHRSGHYGHGDSPASRLQRLVLEIDGEA